jgi:hypothetical protein
VEQIFDVGRGQEGKLAMVAMGRANDEDDAVGIGPATVFGGILPTPKAFHGCSLCSKAVFRPPA